MKQLNFVKIQGIAVKRATMTETIERNSREKTHGTVGKKTREADQSSIVTFDSNQSKNIFLKENSKSWKESLSWSLSPTHSVASC